MASITIRNPDTSLKSRLRVQAAYHGGSMEDKAPASRSVPDFEVRGRGDQSTERRGHIMGRAAENRT
jgi:hypothetical protein